MAIMPRMNLPANVRWRVSTSFFDSPRLPLRVAHEPTPKRGSRHGEAEPFPTLVGPFHRLDDAVPVVPDVIVSKEALAQSRREQPANGGDRRLLELLASACPAVGSRRRQGARDRRGHGDPH